MRIAMEEQAELCDCNALMKSAIMRNSKAGKRPVRQRRQFQVKKSDYLYNRKPAFISFLGLF